MSRPSRTAPYLVVFAAAVVGAWIAAVSLHEKRRAPPTGDDGGEVHLFPHLALGEDRISFGTMYDDQEEELSLVLSNTGGRVLHIEHVDTNCGCFRVGEAPREIAPGASATLRLKVRLAGMDGHVERVVAIHTDDPKAISAHVAVVGEVRPRLAIDPPKIELRPASAAAPGELDVTVRATDGAPIAGMTATSLTPGLTVTARVGDGTASLHVVAAPFAEDFSGSIVLKRGSYERILAVLGVAYCDVRVVPARLDAGVVHGTVTLDGKLVGEPGVEWRVVSVKCNRQDFDAEVRDGVLHATIGERAPDGLFAGLVTIDLEGAKPSRLLVPVTGFVER